MLWVALRAVNVWELGVSASLPTFWSAVTVAVALRDPSVAVIVVVPLATAAIIPEVAPMLVTLATLVSDEAQVIVPPVMVFPPESWTIASESLVSPIEAKDTVVAPNVILAATLAAGWPTVTVAVALTDPEVAVIVAVPLATAVMSPADDTVAALVFDELQVTVAPDMAVPPLSLTVGVKVAVSPTDTNDMLVGDRVMDATAWPILTVTVALTDPDVAVMVAVPLATAVMSPADDTVAILVLDEAHVTVAPDIVAEFWSLTVAESCSVSPRAVKLTLPGESVMVVVTGAGGVVGVVGEVGVLGFSPPQLWTTSHINRQVRGLSSRPIFLVFMTPIHQW
jgi:hypothetical protein